MYVFLCPQQQHILPHWILQLVRIQDRSFKRLMTMISLCRKQNFSFSFTGYQSSTQQGILCHAGHSFKQARYGEILVRSFFNLLCRLKLFWSLEFILLDKPKRNYLKNLAFAVFIPEFLHLNSSLPAVYQLLCQLLCVRKTTFLFSCW